MDKTMMVTKTMTMTKTMIINMKTFDQETGDQDDVNSTLFFQLYLSDSYSQSQSGLYYANEDDCNNLNTLKYSSNCQ